MAFEISILNAYATFFSYNILLAHKTLLLCLFRKHLPIYLKYPILNYYFLSWVSFILFSDQWKLWIFLLLLK